MKLLDWISERLKPKPAEPDLVHGVFGPLAAEDDCWQTLEPIPFKPLAASIFVTITAGENGPGEEHVEFFRSFADTYMSEFERAEQLLGAEVARWLEREVPGNLWDQLTFSSMSIPAAGDRRADWDLSFECPEEDGGHLFTVYFEGGEPVSVSVDG